MLITRPLASGLFVAFYQANEQLIERHFRYTRYIGSCSPVWGAVREQVGFLISGGSWREVPWVIDENKLRLLGAAALIALFFFMRVLPLQLTSMKMYFLNPVLLFSFLWSPLPAVEHCTIYCLPFFVSDAYRSLRQGFDSGGLWKSLHGYIKVLQCFFVVLGLMAFDYHYVLLVPFLLRLCDCSHGTHSKGTKKKGAGEEDILVARQLPFMSLATIVVFLLVSSVSQGEDQLLSSHWSFDDIYMPSSSVFWYLEAQIFPEFRAYFIPLLSSQPSVLAVLIFLACSTRQGQDERRRTLQHHPLFSYHVMVVVVLIFKPHMTLCDLAFAVTLLAAYYRSETRAMKHSAWILAGLLVTSMLQVLTMHLWITKGTGNANFLFFQNFAQLLFIEFGLIEIVRASLLPAIEKAVA